MNSKYKLVYGSHRNSHCRNKKSKTLVGGCSVAVLCLATARTSCLTAVRTLPLTRRLSFPILPLGPWLSSPRRSLSTPLSTSRARSGITHEYSSTGRLSPYPSDAPSHESSSRDQTVANYHPPRLHRICALNELDENLLYIRLLFPFIRLMVCGRSNNNSIHACASG